MPSFPQLSQAQLVERLTPPEGIARVLIDTDTANEIDDQYALAWALLSPERLVVEAVTAEPYSFAHHQPELLAAERALEGGDTHAEHLVGGFQGWLERLHAQGRRAADLNFVGPAEGMERSYAEILNIYEKLGIAADGKVFRGAPSYMRDPETPIRSEAVEVIIDLAKSGDAPLHIAAMGCVPNIASALLLAPEIVERLEAMEGDWAAGAVKALRRACPLSVACCLLAIRKALETRGELTTRKRVLVPASAHGTNPATAIQCGFDVDELDDWEPGIPINRSRIRDKDDEFCRAGATRR